MKDVLKIQPNVSNQIQSARMYAKKRKIKKKKQTNKKKNKKQKGKYAMLCYAMSVCLFVGSPKMPFPRLMA